VAHSPSPQPLIGEEDVVPLLQMLIRVPSVGLIHGEKGIADAVAEYLRSHGIVVRQDEVLPGRPNVIAQLGDGPGTSLVFNAHLDTVQPGEGWTDDPYSGRLVNGKVYGRGAVDDKGPLAAMIAALVAVKASGQALTGRLILCAVIDEENASEGSKALARVLHADMGVVGEATAGDLVLAHNGSLRPRLKVAGRSAHTSRPEEGINAIEKAVPIVLAVGRLHSELRDRTHPLTGSASASVSMIRGGDQPNMIPDTCTLVLDRRMIPGESQEQALRELESFLDDLMSCDPDLRVSIDELVPTTGGPAEISASEQVVVLLQEAIRGEYGREPRLRGMGGACDMVHMLSAGIPTAVYGPGDPSLAHKPNEHIAVGELLRGARVYARCALQCLA